MKILVVDDTAVDLAKIKQIVERAGHRVTTARDGMEAVEKALADAPDMIFMDILMPRMDGFRATTAMRAIPALATVPIILVSANSGAANVDIAKKRGAQALIGKPFLPHQIIEQISNQFAATQRATP